MIELARFALGLVEAAAAIGALVFCTYGYGRWWR